MKGQCTAIKANGGRCQKPADGPNGLCWTHNPANAERRRRASRGGKRGGRGRPGGLRELKAEIRSVIADVLGGEVGTGPVAVALQGYNALIRAEKLEMDIREQRELIERLEALEATQQEAGGKRWRA